MLRGSALQVGIQHRFDVLTRLHVLKTILPIRQASNAADDEVEVDLAGRDHLNDALPDRPVVGEASLHGDCFLNHGVEIEAQRLRSPAHFDDLACGPDHLHG